MQRTEGGLLPPHPVPRPSCAPSKGISAKGQVCMAPHLGKRWCRRTGRGWGRAVRVKSLQGLGAWPSAILSNSSRARHTSTQTLATPQVPETLTAAGGGVRQYIRWGSLIRGFYMKHVLCLASEFLFLNIQSRNTQIHTHTKTGMPIFTVFSVIVKNYSKGGLTADVR